MNRDLPEILKLLKEKADIEINLVGEERGFTLYEADLTEWRLRFSDKTPFIVVSEGDVQRDLERVWDAILEVVVVHKWQYSLPIIIIEGNDESLGHKVALARETHFTMAVLDDQVAQSMGKARSSRFPMLDAILSQIPRRDLLPFETAAPVTGSAFFDRQPEVRRVVKPTTSYAVTGVRRIGKTSLLLEAQRRMKDQHNTVFLICSTLQSREEFIREVVRALRPTELRHLQHHYFNFTDFLRRMPKYKKGRITLFLDEVDDLIEIDKLEGYYILNALRDARISAEGHLQFVFAGSTRLENEIADHSSPLYNMVEKVPLEAFSHQQARALICQPFETVRIKIKNSNEVVDRIYRETGGHPNLIQHYCVLLADLMDREGRGLIEVGDLIQVYTGLAFREYVLRSFEINTGPMDRLIVYLMANCEEFQQGDIDIALKDEGITASFYDINEACGNLEKVAVLRKTGPTYQFALSLLPVMLEQNYDLGYLVTKAREELRR